MYIPIIEICSALLMTCEVAINRRNATTDPVECIIFLDETFENPSLLLSIVHQSFPNPSSNDKFKFNPEFILEEKLENHLHEKGYETSLQDI